MRVESKITIEADIETVWNAITSIQSYSSWNPFIVEVDSFETPPVEGVEMRFHLLWKDGSKGKSRELVSSFNPPQKVSSIQKGEWSYRFISFFSSIGMIKAKRFHIVTSEKEGETNYHTYEDFKGWGVNFLPIINIQDGFDRQTKALKAYCETAADA